MVALENILNLKEFKSSLSLPPYKAIVHTVLAVSYTHLDVYKRQGCDTTSTFFNQGKNKFAKKLEKQENLQFAAKIFYEENQDPIKLMQASTAVSYTHLDVYKRQLPSDPQEANRYPRRTLFRLARVMLVWVSALTI